MTKLPREQGVKFAIALWDENYLDWLTLKDGR